MVSGKWCEPATMATTLPNWLPNAPWWKLPAGHIGSALTKIRSRAARSRRMPTQERSFSSRNPAQIVAGSFRASISERAIVSGFALDSTENSPRSSPPRSAKIDIWPLTANANGTVASTNTFSVHSLVSKVLSAAVIRSFSTTLPLLPS